MEEGLFIGEGVGGEAWGVAGNRMPAEEEKV